MFTRKSSYSWNIILISLPDVGSIHQLAGAERDERSDWGYHTWDWYIYTYMGWLISIMNVDITNHAGFPSGQALFLYRWCISVKNCQQMGIFFDQGHLSRDDFEHKYTHGESTWRNATLQRWLS